MKNKTIALLLSAFFILFSCAGNSGRYDSKEKLFFAKKKKDGGVLTAIEISNGSGESGFALISSPSLPAFRIKGEAFYPDEKSIMIRVDSISVISSWPNGWTAGEWEASGLVLLEGSGETYRCVLKEPVMLWDIKKGEIRYYDTYFRKDDGLQKARNRMERIKEVSRFLRERNKFPAVFGDIKKETIYGKSMNDSLAPFLFPETVNQKKRAVKESIDPAFIKGNNKKEYSYGAEKRWRSDYTRALFPQHLQNLRDSGTIWRDYEEAPGLFMSVYNLEYYLQHILDGSDFIKQ